MKPTHLAIICGALDAQQPAGAQVIGFANDLAEHGYRVTLFALSGAGDELDPRVDLMVAGSRPRATWLAMFRYRCWLTRAIANAQVDSTISTISTVPATIMMPFNGTAFSRSRVKRSLRPGIVGQLIGRLSDLRPNTALTHLLERRAMSSSAVQTMIAISPPIKDQLQTDLKKQTLPITLARLPQPKQRVTTERAAQLREQLARAWGISHKSYWIVLPFVDARLGGFESMLRAAKPLIEQGVDAVLLLAGPTRYTHLVWIGQLGLREHVRLVGTTSMAQELMSASDLVVSPTSYDPAGWAVRPALALGKPIVTTTACGVAKEVSMAGGSVLSAPAEPDALLKAIRDQYARWDSGPMNPSSDTLEPSQEPNLVQAIDQWAQQRDSPA